MTRFLLMLMLSCSTLLGCSGQKKEAEAAFAQIQASAGPVSADLEKYAPDEYAKFSALHSDMKRLLNSSDYAGVLALQPQVAGQFTSASGAAARNRNAAATKESREWRLLSASVPILVSELRERLTGLKDMAGLPAGISRAHLREVEAALPELNAEWSATLAAVQSNDLSAAIEKAHAIRQRCVELGARLGIRAT